MRICVVSIFTNELYRKLIPGWLKNMEERFLPDAEREWFIATDMPDHPDFLSSRLSLHFLPLKSMGKPETWRAKWQVIEDACDWAKENGCTHVIFAQANVRCLRVITTSFYRERMEEHPVSIRHMKGLRGTQVQGGLCWGTVDAMKKFSHFWRGKVEDEAWWKMACAAKLYDEFELSAYIKRGELRGLVGYADDGFSHAMERKGTWRNPGMDMRDKVMGTIDKRNWEKQEVYIEKGVYREYVQPVVRGGLGNVLFQLAHAYAYAKRYGYTPVVSYAGLARCGCRELLIRTKLPEFFSNADALSDVQFFRVGCPIVYDGVKRVFGGNVLISGYVQGEPWFHDAAEDVRKLFYPLVGKKRRAKSVAIHIRGGDYLRGGFYTLSREDVERALFRYLDTDRELIIVTNDKAYCDSLISPIRERLEEGYLFVTQVVGGKETMWEDFSLLSSAEILITSASTYSWWAGYLGHADKVYIPNTEGSLKNNAYFYRMKCDEWEYI